MPPTILTRRNFAPHWSFYIIGAATAIMSALAGGAIWCLVTLLLNHESSWLALPIGCALAQVMRRQPLLGRVWNALIAIILTGSAALYSYYLLAAIRIADLLGISLQNALLQMDPALGFSLIQTMLGTTQWIWLISGTVLSAGWALRGHTRPIQPNT